jgi:hypothetical protein
MYGACMSSGSLYLKGWLAYVPHYIGIDGSLSIQAASQEMRIYTWIASLNFGSCPQKEGVSFRYIMMLFLNISVYFCATLVKASYPSHIFQIHYDVVSQHFCLFLCYSCKSILPIS